MFGNKSKNVDLISPAKLAKMQAILAAVGLDDPDHWGFSHHVQNRDSYFGGSLEWSERGKNMRYYFYARPDSAIYHVDVFVLSGGKNFLYSDETIAEANRQLAELFND